MTDAVTHHFTKDTVPIYMVEKPEFIHMLKTIERETVWL